MVFSEKYGFLFIEVPLTGSWSIHLELCDRYQGKAILHKHATYQEYISSPYSKIIPSPFVFATIRNPLDEAVSRYFKYKSDHKSVFSDPNSLQDLKVDYADVEKFQFIQQTGANFSAFFLKYYRRPYGNIVDYFSDELSYLLRFERLQIDFLQVLIQLNIEPAAKLPFINKTADREEDWKVYYSPEAIERAKRVMGPFMLKWGYAFPEEWGQYRPGLIDQLQFRSLNTFRRLYSENLRFSQRAFARLLRRLRSIILN